MPMLLTVAAALTLSGPALAVPAFQRLYQKKYEVQAGSCLLCHGRGAGSKLNDYGRAFLKAGAGLSAFTAIEGSDADGDGVGSLEELRAGANPGNPSSTPETPGAWLASTRLEDAVPLDELVELFPKTRRFELRDVELSDADAAAIEKDLGGAPLSFADRFTTLYFPVDETKSPPARAGVAVFSADALADGLLLTAVALGPEGTVRKAWGVLLGGTGRDSLRQLARQIVGKDVSSRLELGMTVKPLRGRRALSAAGLRAFRRTLLTVSHVLAAK